MSRKLGKKLMYVIVVMAVLAMMIPMSIPVSAVTTNGLYMTTANTAGAQVDDSGYNVLGTVVRVTSTGGPADNWTASGGAILLGSGADWAEFVSYTTTESQISARLVSTNAVLGPVGKKWGTLTSTAFTMTGSSSFVTWNEGTKSWASPVISITDTVTGTFTSTPMGGYTHTAQGAILNWFLVDGYQTIPMAAGEANPDPHDNTTGLMGTMNRLVDARFARFSNGTTYIQTVTGANGASTVTFSSTGEESVKIVVIPAYPGNPQLPTIPEVISYNFKTHEKAVVPQVRWAGEKIVLEANFGITGDNVTDYVVKFSLPNESAGTLNAINDFAFLNLANTTTTVWTAIDRVTGLASVVLENQNQGQVDVDATLYGRTGINGDAYAVMDNQQAFTVFYLKFESLVLSDVIGKRAEYNQAGILISHKSGMWEEANPWDASQDYEMLYPGDDNHTLNVSQDALLRAQVKGWFTNSNPTTRPEGFVDVSSDWNYQLSLPYGRYVLPDDWAFLAGDGRLHWDIMDAPDDTVTTHTNSPLGPYYKGATLVAAAPVVGPFSPGIETMLDTGWATGIVSTDPLRQFKTVVPNGVLDAWDAPMPPAKIIFEIQSGVGFFKDAFKDTIYYLNNGTNAAPAYVYTAPFYFANIPAHWAIPPTIANGGYDWDTFDFNADASGAYGAYPFWKIINQPDGVVTPENASLPTKVEVYSDNHGEAMVYLNGDANLKLVGANGGSDIPYMAEVGQTTVQAWADYPYIRKHQEIYSDVVTKTWTWGGRILGVDGIDSVAPMVLVAGKSNNLSSDDFIQLTHGLATDADAQGISNKHVVWVWATDRDGMQAGMLGAQVDWVITGASSRFYNGAAFTGINLNAPHSTQLSFDGNGFLAGTGGTRAAGPGISVGTSYLRKPTTAEAGIFYKFYNVSHDPDGLQPTNFAVAAIDIVSDTQGTVKVSETITSPEYATGSYTTGTIMRATNFVTTNSYPLDDQIVLGDANLDGNVNMMDITSVERIILGMDALHVAQADANCNMVIDMGDVIRIEKTYLGLK